MSILSKKDVAALFNRDETTVSSWMKEQPPIPNYKQGKARLFDTVKVIDWYVAKCLKKEADAQKRGKKSAFDGETSLSVRIEETQLRIAQVKLATMEGQLIPVDAYRAGLDAQCSRLQAVIRTIPSRYMSVVQTASSPVEAQAALEQIKADALAALLRTEEEALDEAAA